MYRSAGIVAAKVGNDLLALEESWKNRMSHDRTEYNRIEPTQRANGNPYEGTSPYSSKLPDMPPPPPEQSRKYKAMFLTSLFALILLLPFFGISGYSIGSHSVNIPATPTPVDIGAIATTSYSQGYQSGNFQGSRDGYSSGYSSAFQTLHDFLYTDNTSSGVPCKSAGITDTSGNSDYRYIRMYQDNSGNWKYECLI